MVCWYDINITLTGSATIDPMTNALLIGPGRGGFIINEPFENVTNQIVLQGINWYNWASDAFDAGIGSNITPYDPWWSFCTGIGMGPPVMGTLRWVRTMGIPNHFRMQYTRCDGSTFQYHTGTFTPGDYPSVEFYNASGTEDVRITGPLLIEDPLTPCGGGGGGMTSSSSTPWLIAGGLLLGTVGVVLIASRGGNKNGR